ncbi:MAG TPA: hypothetical protein VM144_18070 [Aestuariivirga sp.]|nr:hypothetical protein [Aestuariivirga sp.]
MVFQNNKSLVINRTEPSGDPYIFGRWHRDCFSLRGFELEARTFIESFFQNFCGKKFIIVGGARTGTTLLTMLLDAVESIRCDGEVLHYKVFDPIGLIQRLARKSSASAFGCKILSYQLYEVQRIAAPDKFLQELRDGGFKIIHLKRNTFVQSLSLSVARIRGTYISTVPANSSEKFYVKPEEFIKLVKWNAALLEYENYILKDIAHVALSYEGNLDLSEAHQATVDKLCEYIGVKSSGVLAPIYKMSDGRIGGNIENFDEIVSAMRASRYAELLDTISLFDSDTELAIRRLG